MEQFTQLGIAGATLFILFLVVRFFIQAIEKKDAYIKEITEKFSDTVNTHLANETASRQQTMDALTYHTRILDQHTQVLGEILGGMKQLNSDAKKIKYGRRKGDRQLIQ